MLNSNIQADEAPKDVTKNDNNTVDINDNWIPYGDHRNAIEHGSGDIILLLDNENEDENHLSQVSNTKL